MSYNVREWVSRKKITLRIKTEDIPSGGPDPGPILVKIYFGDGLDLRAASSGEFKPKTKGTSVPRVWELKVSIEGDFEPGIYQILISRMGVGPGVEEIQRFQIY